MDIDIIPGRYEKNCRRPEDEGVVDFMRTITGQKYSVHTIGMKGRRKIIKKRRKKKTNAPMSTVVS